MPSIEAPTQQSLWGGVAPAQDWDPDATRGALDELFSLSRQYRTGKEFRELLTFIGRFRFYSPFNVSLLHAQMPGATYVAPAHRWLHKFTRRIRTGARPLVMLKPMGPVMFVYDVSDTEPLEGAPPLPPEVERPFEVRQGYVGTELERTISNGVRDGIEVATRDAGSQSAGVIRIAEIGRSLSYQYRERPVVESVRVPLRYEVLLNAKHSREAQYATLVHELAHLYCGHLGTPDIKWWPDRHSLPHDVAELEAESVCYLLCDRLGIDNPSDAYLSQYLKDDAETPAINLDWVMKAAGLIEKMGSQRFMPRRPQTS